MGEIAVHEFITLDGVIEEPTWTMDYPFDPRMGEAIAAIMAASKGLLLGRRTFEMFAPAWSSRSAEDDPGAPFMNESPKYVVSSTLQDLTWNNSTRVNGDVAEEVANLKEQMGGDLLVAGSATLVRTLVDRDLVDELRLMVFPGGCSTMARPRPSSSSCRRKRTKAASCISPITRRPVRRFASTGFGRRRSRYVRCGAALVASRPPACRCPGRGASGGRGCWAGIHRPDDDARLERGQRACGRAVDERHSLRDLAEPGNLRELSRRRPFHQSRQS